MVSHSKDTEDAVARDRAARIRAKAASRAHNAREAGKLPKCLVEDATSQRIASQVRLAIMSAKGQISQEVFDTAMKGI